MHNSWKGLIVGGLTGAFVGIALDLFGSAVEHATRGAEHARERVPDAADWMHGISDKATEWAHDNDVPERVRDVAQRILRSDLAATTNVRAMKVVEVTKEKARSTMHRSS